MKTGKPIRKLQCGSGNFAAPFVILTALALSACDSDNATLVNRSSSATAAILTSPVDVMAEARRSAASSPLNMDNINLLANGGFENGRKHWFGCSSTPDAGTVVADAYDGANALQVRGANCLYQSIEVAPDTDFILSCYVKVTEHLEWTGLGIGFSDSNWNELGNGAVTVVSGQKYTRYDVRATSPKTALYASMWLYTDTSSTIDSCTLSRAQDAPAPPITTDTNLLINGDFEQVDNNMPANWFNYCAGSAAASPGNGEAELILDSGACVAQSLSTNALSAMQGNTVELTCDFDYSSAAYAVMIINLDGIDQVARIPAYSSSAVDYIFKAPDELSSGFVSIYSEGAPNSLRMSSCYLQVAQEEPDTETPDSPSNENNLLVNGSFDQIDSNNKPQGWTKECAGSWDTIASPISEAAVELSGETLSCMSQKLTNDAVSQLSEKAFELSCDVQRFSEGYATIQIHYNNGSGRLTSGYIPAESNYETFLFTGELSYTTDAEVKIYASKGASFDNCVLTAAFGEEPVSIDIRANAEGNDVYNVSGPLIYDVVVTNNGSVSLTDVNYTSTDGLCSGSIAALDIGDSINGQCENPIVFGNTLGYSAVTVTATAITPDGNEVADSDLVGHSKVARANPDFLLSVTARKRAVQRGDDAVFVVNVATVGNVSGLDKIDSNQADCVKIFEPGMMVGDYNVYECTVANVQEDIITTVSATTCTQCTYITSRTDSALVTVNTD